MKIIIHLFRIYGFSVFCMGHNSVISQEAIFNWETEICVCSGTFDSTQISRDQLINTFEYLYQNQYMTSTAIALKPDEIETLSHVPVEKQCNERLNALQNADFVKKPEFWGDLRQKRIDYIERLCKLKSITIQAYYQPEALNNFELNIEDCNPYRDALIAGGDRMMKAWKLLVDKNKKTNANPERLEQVYRNQRTSPDSLTYARMDLMAFGWWNCANNSIVSEEEFEKIETGFTKLFTNVNCSCEDP